MADTWKDDKLDLAFINAQGEFDAEVSGERDQIVYLYDFTFLSPDGLLEIGTYNAVFDHILTTQEVVNYFSQFYEVKNSHYKVQYGHPAPIYRREADIIAKNLRDELGAFYNMDSSNVELQDEDSAIARALENPQIQKQIKEAKARGGKKDPSPVITSKEV